MGVPFNFKCIGVGTYVCSRCGYELFGSTDKLPSQKDAQAIKGDSSPLWPSFVKTIKPDSIVRILTGGTDSSSSTEKLKIVCGKCKAPIGFELLLPKTEGNPASINSSPGLEIPSSVFKVPPRSLKFIQSKCSVPMSFLF